MPLLSVRTSGEEIFSSDGRRCLPPFLIQLIDKSQYLGDGLIKFGRDRLIDIQFAQYLDEGRIIPDGNAMLHGKLYDLLRNKSAAFRRESGRPVLSRVIRQRRRLSFLSRFFHGTVSSHKSSPHRERSGLRKDVDAFVRIKSVIPAEGLLLLLQVLFHDTGQLLHAVTEVEKSFLQRRQMGNNERLDRLLAAGK